MRRYSAPSALPTILQGMCKHGAGCIARKQKGREGAAHRIDQLATVRASEPIAAICAIQSRRTARHGTRAGLARRGGLPIPSLRGQPSSASQPVVSPRASQPPEPRVESPVLVFVAFPALDSSSFLRRIAFFPCLALPPRPTSPARASFRNKPKLLPPWPPRPAFLHHSHLSASLGTLSTASPASLPSFIFPPSTTTHDHCTATTTTTTTTTALEF